MMRGSARLRVGNEITHYQDVARTDDALSIPQVKLAVWPTLRPNLTHSLLSRVELPRGLRRYLSHTIQIAVWQ